MFANGHATVTTVDHIFSVSAGRHEVKQVKTTCLSVFQPIAPARTACYNPRNDYDGDDVGRSQLAESRRVVRGGSRVRAQSPPESPGTPFDGYNGEGNEYSGHNACEEAALWPAIRLHRSDYPLHPLNSVQPMPGAPVTALAKAAALAAVANEGGTTGASPLVLQWTRGVLILGTYCMQPALGLQAACHRLQM
jgi:hypothetical protein